MDTGQSGAFFDNAEKMGVSLDKLDALLLSHAHYDHVGGVERLLENIPIEKMYVGKSFFQEKYHEKKDGTIKNIGISFSRNDVERYGVKIEKNKPVIVCGDLNVAHKEIDLKNPKTNRKNAGFTVEESRWQTVGCSCFEILD